MGRLDGVFGMVEMELAASIIISKCLERNTWNCPIRYSDFPGSDSSEQAGFLSLLCYGWMLPVPTSKRSFIVNKNFVERVVKKFPETASLSGPDAFDASNLLFMSVNKANAVYSSMKEKQ